MDEIQEKSSYKKLSETLRHIAPLDFQCQVFCKGKKCKYEGSEHWPEHQMALDGIFSTWVTCNILAMARPNTAQIVKYNLIAQFQKNGIRTIINLQQAGEHAYCGNGLEIGGFSYSSSLFMENGIFFYNFPWRDYGVATLESITDVMKVIAFALVEGKVAVHCHAGLGRTGVVIACYLVYSCRINGNEAIRYVRMRRPNSIQTRMQITTVVNFQRFIAPSFIVINVGDYDEDDAFTLDEYLRRQSRILHGLGARNYKYLPKFVHIVCERLLQLANLQPVVANAETITSDSMKDLFWKNFIGMKNQLSNISTPKSPSISSANKFNFDTSSASLLSQLTQTDYQIPPDTNEYRKQLSVSPPAKNSKLNSSKSKGGGKTVLKTLKKVLNLKKKHSIIDEETLNVSPSISGYSSRQSSRDSIESYVVDVSSLEDELESEAPSSPKSDPGSQSGKKCYPPSTSISASNLIEIDSEEEPFITWSRWKRKLDTEFDDSQATSSELVDSMERIVSQQSSLVLSDNEGGVVNGEFIFTATLPVQPVKFEQPKTLLTANQLAAAMTMNPEKLPQEMLKIIEELAHTLNDDTQNGWNALIKTSDPVLLIGLLYIWLEQLQQPLLSKQDWTQIHATDYINDPTQALQKLSRSSRVTLEYLVRFVAHIEPINLKQRTQILKYLILTLMQHETEINSKEIDDATNFALAIIKLIQNK